ncbi:MAG: hypothetical protein COW54_06170 [Rhodobacteraceae bacterium CG17_big_fil_post_rev_8_21_14_2_50_63_15]|nr:hypothetical protein [Roseovarius sp.]PIV79060.1 MAG: hypothetical protein COW54_06170 [Rhodobacteraceae bacterium CG17_big_fil_post_rev_8_21_14_2_50_63_15]
MTRHIILHYHLFKNAGTSLDAILRQNFGPRWLSAEFPMEHGPNTSLVEAWIRQTPEGRAYSSHTALGPLPEIAGVEVIPVILLRDPIARIRSAYHFERQQAVETWEAHLARTQDFAGYVRTRLARDGDRQCRNFQTYRLASLIPGEAPELDRARQALSLVLARGVLGRVEAFDAAMTRLSDRIRPHHPAFTWHSLRANARRNAAHTPVPDTLLAELNAANADDFALLAAFSEMRHI